MSKQDLDRRLNVFRPDIAAAHLAGAVEAARFVEGKPARVVAGTLSVREAPDTAARQSTELLFNETFVVYDRADGWAWGQNLTDGYVGYVRESGLGAVDERAFDREVQALRTYLYPAPDLKTIPLDMLHMTTRVRVSEQSGKYSRIDGGGWVYSAHLCEIREAEPDYLSTAERFLGAPYGWGGRSSFGLDCSGLVQIALARAGVAVPRDSDMQEQAVGTVVEGGLEAAEPGDLLFTRGHVMFLAEPGLLLHANGYHMAVTYEPLEEFISRTKDLDLSIRTVRRPRLP